MSNLGLGVLINLLGGNEGTFKAVEQSISKQIGSIAISDNTLAITFDDGSTLSIFDNGQSCCEMRYMSADADLSYFSGATLVKLEITTAPNIPAGGEEHEVQFLDVHTSKGMFQVANHNEHNGYYGGFSITARFTPAHA